MTQLNSLVKGVPEYTFGATETGKGKGIVFYTVHNLFTLQLVDNGPL